MGDEIIFGLGGIKGVGQAAVDAIIEARAKVPGGKFATVLEFFEFADLRRVNKKVIECLIKAGAFDNLHANRAQLYAGFEKFLDSAEKTRKDREVGQVSIFELEPADQKKDIELPNVPSWNRSLKLSNEKEVLGFYISDHPLAGLDSVLRNHVTCHITGLKDQPSKKKVGLGGIVTGLKEIITKKGKRMAFAQLEDQTGVVELVIFPETFMKYGELFKTSRPLIIAGMHEQEEGISKILVDDVKTLENADRTKPELIVTLDASRFDVAHIAKLAEVFGRHQGEVKSRVDVVMPEIGRHVTLELGAEYNVAPTEAFFEDLERQLGSNGLASLN